MAALVPSGPLVEDPIVARAVRRRANTLYGIKADSTRFPAVMPASVDDTNAESLRQEHYLALEKTDGVHGVLVMARVQGKPIAALIMRSGAIYRMNIPAAAPFYNGSLFEGELVRWRPPADPKTRVVPMPHPHAHRTMRFVIFEALVIAGVDLKKLPFHERLNAARYVAEPASTGGADLSEKQVARRIAACKLTLAHEDTWLDAKTPRTVAQAVDIVRGATQPCDGVVFIPNVPFRMMGNKWPILKKKDKDTIDFLIRFEKNPDASTTMTILYTCGEDLLDVMKTLRYKGRDVRIHLRTRHRPFKRYINSIKDSMAVESTHEEVCEFTLTKPVPIPEDAVPDLHGLAMEGDTRRRDFGYEVEAAFVKPRLDKPFPNTNSTIVRTFLGMAFTLEEVVERATREEAPLQC